MAASVDYHPPSFGVIPHRRPLPTNAHPQFSVQPEQFTHSRTRTTSSNVLPQNYPHYTAAMVPGQTSNRRTLSNATTSTTASSNASQGNAPVPSRNPPPPSSYASSIRRSTSSRSGASQGSCSYVALLRKQKATVWCDRAQHDDPRLLAQQRAAKARAQAEMVGGGSSTTSLSGRNPNSSSGGLTGGVRSKIRHHGAVKASAYSGGLGAQGNLSGAGVPMRLSASEVDDEQNSENGDDALDRRYHQRNGSGRSSLGSNSRTQSGYFSIAGGVGTAPTPQGPPGALQMTTIRTRSSASSTPPSGVSPVEARRNSFLVGGERLQAQHHHHQSPHEDETPMPVANTVYGSGGRSDYFTQAGGNGGSGSSSEERFGEVGALQQRYQGVEQQAQKKTIDELRRRGSVDDRTSTMSGVRLFVANPDLDN